MSRRNDCGPGPNLELTNFVLAIIAPVALAACALMAKPANAQDTPLDLLILSKLDAPTVAAPTAQAPRDALNLSLLDRLDQPAATAPGDALDVTLLDALDAPTGKPAVKPSKAAMRSLGAASGVDLGDEIGREACRPSQSQAATEINYPERSHNWTFPGGGRSALILHLTTAPQHRGKFTLDTLARLETSELKALHSDDHEGRRKPVTIAEAPRQSAATCPNGVCPVPSPAGQSGKMPPVTTSPPTWGGTRFYWPSNGQWRDSPQPGTNYPTMGGVLVPVGSTPQAAAQVFQSRPVMVRSNCPGGVCPVN